MNEKVLQRTEQYSAAIHMEICRMIASLPNGHLGGSLSVADTLAVLYESHLRYHADDPHWAGRDWVVMSKGHCGPALYAALALKGFFPIEELATLNTPHTDLPSHCDRNHTPGVDMTTGSLGQGASTAAGVAMGLKMDELDNRVYLILGDGELDEGQVWEMAMFAATKHLDNLVALIDYNKLQIDGRTDTDDVCNLGDIAAKFEAFGWYTQRVNGHDLQAVNAALTNAGYHRGVPSAIVLDTVKGHGWSEIENQAGSHSRGLNAEELERALEEIRQRYHVR